LEAMPKTTVENSICSGPAHQVGRGGAVQTAGLAEFGERINRIGFNFAVFDAAGELVVLCEGDTFKSDAETLKKAAVKAMKRDAGLHRLGTKRQILATGLKAGDEVVAAALIDMGQGDESDGKGAGRKKKASCERDLPADILGEMLIMLAEKFAAESRAERETEMVGTELAQVYEELVLLYKLGANMKVTEADGDFLQMACDSLTDIVSVEGIAILLERSVDGEEKLVLAAGSGIIDADEYTTIMVRNRLIEQIEAGKEALLDSEVDSPFKYRWPENIRSILAVPLFGKEKAGVGSEPAGRDRPPVIGQMVAINRLDKPDFDSTDVKLFNSVANGCAVFIENGRLFSDLKELFIGSLKALTSSIDAKDPYTRGHSERVAFISRWIAERLSEQGQLDAEQIPRIYLAGLLHDIGKVGVEEVVLRKKGKLNDAEFEQIKKHPAIGAGILSGIKQMSDIVPGVLSHHERVDGKGYPNGISGERIPLIARIIGLADSFDAMTSKRTYRDAMSAADALVEIEKCLGSQFDEQIGRIFLSGDVHRLWDVIQDGSVRVYGAGSFSEYGAEAVGVLVR